jgi:acetyl-CoA carboxylase carboxyltransferase component
MSTKSSPGLDELFKRLEKTLDVQRTDAQAARHKKGYRRDYEDLQSSTAADGIITGTCTMNAAQFGTDSARAAVIVNDYSVLAGTQGYSHHKKLDRICELAGSPATHPSRLL